MSGGCVPLDIIPHRSPDGEEFVTRQQAAALMGVKPDTIATWERRGHLARIPGCPPRRPLYRMADVIDAEYKARQAALRTSGTETRVRRHFRVA